MSEPLIQRYEHHGFTGWVVSATRRNKRFTRYFSDHPNGQRKALQAARVYRDKLLSRLPPPKKIRIKDKRNTTGVIGVCRQEYRESPENGLSDTSRSGRRVTAQGVLLVFQ